MEGLIAGGEQAIVLPLVMTSLEGRLLIVRFAEAHEVLSWAIVNGGRRRAGGVVWLQVDELGEHVDPRALLSGALEAAGLPDAVGLLTACDLSRFEEVSLSDGGLSARCVATVGLGNALAAGDPPGVRRVGTINLLCQVSCALSEEALIEACALAAEARTAAVVEAHIQSTRSTAWASGTGTDCIVIAAPMPSDGPALEYAGKHTPIGALIGRTVRTATAQGVRRWLEARC